MADDRLRLDVLAAALRAQASGSLAGSPSGAGHAPLVPPSRKRAQARPGLPVWALLAMAVLLGAMAGGLAGVISALGVG